MHNSWTASACGKAGYAATLGQGGREPLTIFTGAGLSHVTLRKAPQDFMAPSLKKLARELRCLGLPCVRGSTARAASSLKGGRQANEVSFQSERRQNACPKGTCLFRPLALAARVHIDITDIDVSIPLEGKFVLECLPELPQCFLGNEDAHVACTMEAYSCADLAKLAVTGASADDISKWPQNQSLRIYLCGTSGRVAAQTSAFRVEPCRRSPSAWNVWKPTWAPRRLQTAHRILSQLLQKLGCCEGMRFTSLQQGRLCGMTSKRCPEWLTDYHDNC